MKLENMTALVTGAASGLGAATAEALAGRGVHVLGLDLADSIDQVGTSSDLVRYIAADVISEDDVAVALEALDEYPPLRLVVNCACAGASGSAK